MERENNREIPEIITLYHLYHYDRKVKRTGAIALEADIGRQWIRRIDALQKKMQSYVAMSDQKQLEECALLSVSTNTDEKGIFSTFQESEYALMACALEQSKDNDDNYLYSKTLVYEWLDRIREFGNQQSFGDISKNTKGIKNPFESPKVIENPSDILIK